MHYLYRSRFQNNRYAVAEELGEAWEKVYEVPSPKRFTKDAIFHGERVGERVFLLDDEAVELIKP